MILLRGNNIERISFSNKEEQKKFTERILPKGIVKIG